MSPMDVTAWPNSKQDLGLLHRDIDRSKCEFALHNAIGCCPWRTIVRSLRHDRELEYTDIGGIDLGL